MSNEQLTIIEIILMGMVLASVWIMIWFITRTRSQKSTKVIMFKPMSVKDYGKFYIYQYKNSPYYAYKCSSCKRTLVKLFIGSYFRPESPIFCCKKLRLG